MKQILTWLWGFQDKFLYLVTGMFSLYPSLFWELMNKRNLKIYNFYPKAWEPYYNIDILNMAYCCTLPKFNWWNSIYGSPHTVVLLVLLDGFGFGSCLIFTRSKHLWLCLWLCLYIWTEPRSEGKIYLKSRQFLCSDHFPSSLDYFSWICIDNVKGDLMLISL